MMIQIHKKFRELEAAIAIWKHLLKEPNHMRFEIIKMECQQSM